MSGYTVIGTCSQCGGPVCVPAAFGSIVPPTPTCIACGAKATQGHGPVIQTMLNHVTQLTKTFGGSK